MSAPKKQQQGLYIDPDNYDPLFDTDFIDDDILLDDKDLADVIGDERLGRRQPRVYDHESDE